MTTTPNPAALIQRLRDHADCHAQVEQQDDEQRQWAEDLREAAESIAALVAERDALRADAERWRWIEQNATSRGSGNGFTLTVFVPHDMEDWGCAIDAALTPAPKEKTNG